MPPSKSSRPTCELSGGCLSAVAEVSARDNLEFTPLLATIPFQQPADPSKQLTESPCGDQGDGFPVLCLRKMQPRSRLENAAKADPADACPPCPPPPSSVWRAALLLWVPGAQPHWSAPTSHSPKGLTPPASAQSFTVYIPRGSSFGLSQGELGLSLTSETPN